MLFEILNHLNTETFYQLHVVSKTLFKICSSFVLYKRRVSEINILYDYKNILDGDDFKSIPNRCKKHTASLYLRELYFNEGLYNPIAYCALLNVVILSRRDIVSIVGFDKDFLSYQLIEAKNASYVFRPSIHVKYSLLEPFFSRKNTNFKTVLKFLLDIRKLRIKWYHSISDLSVLNDSNEQKFSIEQKFRARLHNKYINTYYPVILRRWSSEFVLRAREFSV